MRDKDNNSISIIYDSLSWDIKKPPESSFVEYKLSYHIACILSLLLSLISKPPLSPTLDVFKRDADTNCPHFTISHPLQALTTWLLLLFFF
jgi:hypothetical protein